MVVNIAINGLGRIGRLVLRNLGNHPNINLIAVNDLVSADNLAYLIKYDSTHGRFSGEVHVEHDCLVLNGKKIKVFNERELSHLSWRESGVDFIVEATGVFTTSETLSKHLETGAKRVIVCSPAKGAIPTFVMGVNHKKYNPSTDLIVSNASCTTNCLALIAKVVVDNFGFAEGLMTTVHAMTASQPSVDGVSKKDWRGGRGAHQNIIPASTGAAQAVTLCLPELKGKLTGMAFRVPVPDVSVVDLTVRLEKPATYQQICQKMMEAAEGEMKGFLEYCDEQLVSSDFISSPFSAIFDAKAGISLNGYFCKLVAWYDNEMGYASRVLDLIDYMAKREKEV